MPVSASGQIPITLPLIEIETSGLWQFKENFVLFQGRGTVGIQLWCRRPPSGAHDARDFLTLCRQAVCVNQPRF